MARFPHHPVGDCSCPGAPASVFAPCSLQILGESHRWHSIGARRLFLEHARRPDNADARPGGPAIPERIVRPPRSLSSGFIVAAAAAALAFSGRLVDFWALCSASPIFSSRSRLQLADMTTMLSTTIVLSVLIEQVQ